MRGPATFRHTLSRRSLVLRSCGRGRASAGGSKRRTPGSGAWLFRVAYGQTTEKDFWAEWCPKIPDLALHTGGTTRRDWRIASGKCGNPRAVDRHAHDTQGEETR